ncbi:MAG: hypothetical protein AAFZ80_14460 [Cyanobacteria bacterium P01_A01_bin.105]
MYIVELTLKHTALPMTVQKKSEEDATATYNSALEALKTGNPVILELTCEKQEGKRVSVLVSELAAVQVYEKSGSASSSGRSPGFFALTAE